MNQLYPIVRRVRRPLVVADSPPVVVGNVEPVNATSEGQELLVETNDVIGNVSTPNHGPMGGEEE